MKISVCATLRKWAKKRWDKIFEVIEGGKYNSFLSLAKKYEENDFNDDSWFFSKLRSDYKKIHSCLKDLKYKTGDLVKKRKEEEEKAKVMRELDGMETPGGSEDWVTGEKFQEYNGERFVSV